MKNFILSFVSVLLIASFAFSTGKKELKEGAGERLPVGRAGEFAASSPWLPVNPAFASQSVSLKSVEFSPKSSTVIWTVGTSTLSGTPSYVYRSADGGASWSQNTIPVGSAGVTNIAVKNDTVAIIGTFNGQVLRTKNGGAKWDTVLAAYDTPGTVAFMDGIAFVGVNRDTAIVMGDANAGGSYVGRSVDGGLTWIRVTALPAEDLTAGKYFGLASFGSCISVTGLNVFTAWYSGSGADPRLLKSTDGGFTWTGANIALPGGNTNNYYWRSINMKDANVGYGVARRVGGATTDFDNWLMKTTNGGTTWDTITVAPGTAHNTQKIYAARQIPGTSQVVGVGFSVTTGAKSWWSTDDGATWTTLVTPGTSNLTSSAFLTPTSGYAVGAFQALQYAPSVAVTFVANTSGVPDTLKTNSFVQVRGSTAQLTWDNLSVKMANGGGDYWKSTVRFAPGTAVQYKFFTNAKTTITGADNGWEANVGTGSTNREMTVGNNDTTLPVQYVNGFLNNAAQSAGPFVHDSANYYACYIKVNLQSYADFNPALHVVGVRGSFAASGWATTIKANVNANHANGGSVLYNGANFYTLVVYWPKALVDTATDAEQKTMRYKWVIHQVGHALTEDWSLMVYNPNFQQEFVMPKKDTTINWVWFDNKPFIPPTGTDTTTFLFTVNLAKAINSNSIKPGDSVSVRYGYNGTAIASTHVMQKKGLTGTLYVDTAKVAGVKVDTSKLGFYYQYYLTKNGSEYREVYYDFFWTGDPTLAEKRKAKVTGKNIVIPVFDTASGAANANRMPYWQSTVKLAHKVRVTYTCDLRPAWYHFNNGDSLFDVQAAFRDMGPGDRDSVYLKWGVWMNGPAVTGWGNPTGNDWGVGLRANPVKKMYDDATHGDKVSGDHIYSLQVLYTDTSTALAYTVGQVFKFGLYGGDNEGGKGGYGNNHVENINDADTAYTLASAFGSINPKWFRAWNYDLGKPTSVSQLEGIPLTYSLDQNYPNPFNPSTTISYSIPANAKVSMKLYNVLGQEVATLVNSSQDAGKYRVTFDAGQYSSGVYFYRIEAGTFSAVKKMMLLK